ncbi:chemotaxis protein CheA [Marinibacterium sp. SX1]|uniref:chemotaxis protein CheA n=1 Tax=Marinibacterium sp. SX1 TaxID=3388424 RepID=UPI003D186B3B
MIEQAVAAFVQEAQEILSELEDLILGLEEQHDQKTVDAVFRGLHTVKGSGAMFGYTVLAHFTHHFENAFELVRAGDLPIDRNLIDLSLEARDLMVRFLALGGDGPESEALSQSRETGQLIDRIQSLTLSAKPTVSASDPSTTRMETDEAMERFSIRFKPLPESLRNGMRPDLLLRELNELGAVDVRFEGADLHDLTELDPTEAYLTWVIVVETTAGRAAVEDVFIFADDADLLIEAADPQSQTPTDPEQIGPNLGAADEPAARPPTRVESKTENIRVASSRLDDMMDSIGELVIAQARLDAVSERLGDSTLDAVVEEVGRLVLGLRDATLSIRMLPIETVFGKFRRVVRDLSQELGKDVRLVTRGGETEVDKNVIDCIGDPLVHMIRNSIDHGIETAEARTAAGKPNQGIVRLSARQEGGEIIIAIEDNGGGLQTDAIRRKAIDRGLIEAEDDLSERDLQNLIFEPGFSTAETVSSVSGRGVGMDAVRSTIDSLGGSIDVVSREGQGTRVTLRLPVTMAIIDGLRVRLGASIYVIPLSAVEECVEMDAAETGRTSGRSVLQIREHVVPYLPLDRIFGLPPSEETRRRVVVVCVGGQRIGLVVDDILGQGQTVIKSLSAYHRDLPGLGGATILGDGRVAIIIDVATLVRWAESRHSETLSKVA